MATSTGPSMYWSSFTLSRTPPPPQKSIMFPPPRLTVHGVLWFMPSVLWFMPSISLPPNMSGWVDVKERVWFLMAFLYFFHFRIILASIIDFWPSFLVQPSSLVEVYNLIPAVLWQLIGLGHGVGEVEMEENYSMDRCALCTSQVEIRTICN